MALALGEVVVLVDGDRAGAAAWVCGYCGRMADGGSELELDLELRAHGVAAHLD